MQSFNDNWDGVVRNRLLKEGVSLKDMGLVVANQQDINDTHKVGRIKTSVNELKRVLGEPHTKTWIGRDGKEGKTTMEWRFKKNVIGGSGDYTRGYEVAFAIYSNEMGTFSVHCKREYADAIKMILGMLGIGMIRENLDDHADGIHEESPLPP